MELSGQRFFGILLGVESTIFAAWETGARIRFDSNVNLAVNHPESDTYLTAYLSLLRDPSGESRAGWTPAIFSNLSYDFTVLDGDLGSSESHGGSIGIGYRF